MVKESKKVRSCYDDLIYGDKATLSKRKEMLKAFPAPIIEQLPDIENIGSGFGKRRVESWARHICP